MQLRRINKRQRAGWVTPVLAAVTSISVVAAAAFGGNDIIKTQEIGSGPITPVVAEGSFAEGNTVVVEDPAIATQGETGGAKAVKEFHRDQQFSQFALTWTGERDIVAYVRAKKADGTWTEWLDTQSIGSNGGEKTGTELIYVGPTNDVQVSVGNIDLYDNSAAGDAARTLPADLDVVFIDGNAQEGIAPVADLTSDAMPAVVSRGAWGADESMRCSSPTYDSGVKALTLHHTAGLNDYSPSQAAAQVRGIYAYHARTMGWCDIGYNVLVDKYGTIYEGRYGGLDKAVQGAHVGGFNSNNWGISMIGNYSTAQPTQTMLESVSAIAGWKAAISGFDPSGTTSLYSGGFGGSKYPAGTTATVPAFLGHNDLHNTECPGNNTMDYWPQIRRDATQKYNAVRGGGSLEWGWNWQDTPFDEGEASEGNTSSDHSSDNATAGDAGGTNKTEATSSVGDSEVPVSTIEALIGIAAAVIGIVAAANAANGGGLPGMNVDPKAEVVAGVTVEETPTIISKVVALTGDAGLQGTWTAVLNAFGPLLGLPVGGPNLADIDTQLVYQLFSNGVVLSSKDTGTHALVGAIAKAWAENPQALGLPTSDEYPVDAATLSNAAGQANDLQGIAGKLIRVDFQGGNITFDPKTQKVSVFTK